MQRTTALVVSVLALSALLGGTAAATGNQPPLADAGLDQSVERGATVQLDANGSRDPDGTIERVEWSIETSDGSTRTPDCPTCVQTTFSPTATGQYNVTVTVTDDDGVSQSDTLQVDVVAAGGPSVSVSAPTALPTDSRRNLTANATAGDADLRTLAWVVNGTARNQTRLTGENGTSTIAHAFNDSGSVSVRAVAYDAAGRRGASNQTVQVVDSSGNGGGGGNSCGANSGNYYVDGQNQGCTSAAMKVEDTFIDTDGRPGLWVYVDSELTQIIKPEKMDELSIDGKGGTFTKETIDVQSQKKEERNEVQQDDGGGSSSSSYDDTTSTDSNSNTDGNTRAGSSVPSNLMDPDDDTSEDEDDGGYDWNYDDNDDDSSSSDSSSDGSSSSDSSSDDSSSDDSSSDGSSSDGSSSDDDGGLFSGGGLFGGGGDDNGGSDDSSSDDDDGGGWSFF